LPLLTVQRLRCLLEELLQADREVQAGQVRVLKVEFKAIGCIHW
jgi:hypothetical protein